MLPSPSHFQYPEGNGKGAPILLIILLYNNYIDDLLQEPADSGVGCHWDNLFVGALAYVDNHTILSPSPSAL